MNNTQKILFRLVNEADDDAVREAAAEALAKLTIKNGSEPAELAAPPTELPDTPFAPPAPLPLPASKPIPRPRPSKPVKLSAKQGRLGAGQGGTQDKLTRRKEYKELCERLGCTNVNVVVSAIRYVYRSRNSDHDVAKNLAEIESNWATWKKGLKLALALGQRIRARIKGIHFSESYALACFYSYSKSNSAGLQAFLRSLYAEFDTVVAHARAYFKLCNKNFHEKTRCFILGIRESISKNILDDPPFMRELRRSPGQ